MITLADARHIINYESNPTRRVAFRASGSIRLFCVSFVLVVAVQTRQTKTSSLLWARFDSSLLV
jgi:hypothetical protein